MEGERERRRVEAGLGGFDPDVDVERFERGFAEREVEDVEGFVADVVDDGVFVIEPVDFFALRSRSTSSIVRVSRLTV